MSNVKITTVKKKKNLVQIKLYNVSLELFSEDLGYIDNILGDPLSAYAQTSARSKANFVRI